MRNAKHDDVDSFLMHEDVDPVTNREPVPRPDEMPVNQPKD